MKIWILSTTNSLFSFLTQSLSSSKSGWSQLVVLSCKRVGPRKRACTVCLSSRQSLLSVQQKGLYFSWSHTGSWMMYTERWVFYKINSSCCFLKGVCETVFSCERGQSVTRVHFCSAICISTPPLLLHHQCIDCSEKEREHLRFVKKVVLTI